MPKKWKTTKIIPLIKADDVAPENPDNYRPLSLLCWTGKVFEKCLREMVTEEYGSRSLQHFSMVTEKKVIT